MVHRRQRRQKARLLGSHQRCWIWGRNVVRETLQALKWPIYELHLADRLPPDELAQAQAECRNAGIPCIVEPAEALERLCRSPEHQGYAAKMPPYPYANVDDILAHLPPSPLFAILDRLQDSHNFGAIIRAAEGFAVDALFVAETGQAEVNSQVARSSAGAVNHVPIAKTGNLAELIARLQAAGVKVYAADAAADLTIDRCDLAQSTALVIGNEAFGIRPELVQACDVRLRIPQSGRVGSLNAAVSAGILFYEARRQRHTKSPHVPQPAKSS